jgi:hypothetical protein
MATSLGKPETGLKTRHVFLDTEVYRWYGDRSQGERGNECRLANSRRVRARAVRRLQVSHGIVVLPSPLARSHEPLTGPGEKSRGNSELWQVAALESGCRRTGYKPVIHALTKKRRGWPGQARP